MGENVPGISLGKFDFSPVCHGCGYPAAKTQSLDALGHVWHHDCFRCKDCNCELTSWYFERDGDLYCKDHYRLRFHEVCNKCMGVTVGPVMVVGEHIYHPECFACMQCGSFIGVEESYILVERSKLYCEECSKSQYSIEKQSNTYEQESLKSSAMKPKHRHLIKLMEFPIPTSLPPPSSSSPSSSSSSSSNNPSTNLPVQFHFMKRKSLGINNQNKDLNYLQVIRTNAELLNENISALQVGDKILEVNGEPIQDSSIEDIENMIKKMQKILVTVERSDSPLRSSNSPNILLSPQSIQMRNYGFNSNDSNSPIQNHYQNNSNYISKNNLSSSDSQNVKTKTASSNLHKNEILPSFIHNGVYEKQSKDYCYNNGGTYKSQASIVLKKASVAKRISRRVQNINHLNNVINNVALNSNKTIVDEKSIDNGFEKADETPSLMPRLRTNPFQRSDAIGSFISGANHDGIKSPSLTYRHSIASPKLDSSPSRVSYLRCNSVKAESRHKIFRPCDLIRGELLGKGFFGQVIKITHKVTNEVMVLKELFRYDKEAHLNFTKEVSVLRTLNHPNLLRFIGVLYMDKKLNIVTEYISGGTLKSKIQDLNEVLSWPRRIQMIQDIAEAMAYLHSRNIIHRDLNSQNCLLKEDGTVVVADFGLARVIPKVCPANHDPIKANNVTSSDTDHTDSQGEAACNVAENSNQMGRKHSLRGGVIKRTINRRQKNKGRRQKRRYTVVGNPYWMAPEMMKGLRYDEKVDVFSFGIVTCEVIGRVQADPDFLPRTSEFGLHIQEFWDKFGGDCPKFFFNIAVLSCQINPEARPSFEDIQMWLVDLAPLGSASSVLPPPLDFDPTSFLSSPAVDLDSEESN